MGTKKKVVDVDKEVLATASIAVKAIRDVAKKTDIAELCILRVITKLIYPNYDVVNIDR